MPHGADFEDVGSDSDGEVDHDIIINSACKMEDQRPHACRALLQLRQHIASASSPPALEVEQFPALSDNYGFLVHDKVSGETAAIDTPEEAAVCDALERRGWHLTAIWNTHWHPDHTGANEALNSAFPPVPVGTRRVLLMDL